MNIGEVIAALMQRSADNGRPLSDNALAELAGVPQPTVTRIRIGESKDPRRSNVEKIARVLGYTADQLYRAAERGSMDALGAADVMPRPAQDDREPAPPPLSKAKRRMLTAASRTVEFLNDDQAAAFAVLLEQAIWQRNNP